MRHEFWSNEPVDDRGASGAISKQSGATADAEALPDGFQFENQGDAAEIAEFLERNYVEDVCSGHSLVYSRKFLEWMFGSECSKRYRIVLRENGVLIGFIYGRKHRLVVNGERNDVVGVNLLCVSREHRGKRIVPLLIREIVRQANADGIYRGIFTAGSELFSCVCVGRYYHRPLRIDRLVEAGFCDRIVPMKKLEARKGTRLARSEDMEAVRMLYLKEIAKHALYDEMDEEITDLRSHQDVIYTYVHESVYGISEFGSFFVIDTVERESGKRIRGAYMWYRGGENQCMIVSDLMCFAEKFGCDVFNCLDIMGNAEFLKEYGFCIGTGVLRYYLYNWKAEKIDKSKVFFVFP
ncbi:glycyl peptide N-tetradecanoyl transferase [Ordospora pajunii]|uniref:glycyl peptide N-tetradecanoyl transferase n=1 Tax=Ordospora pajunii TaxID=3039483 RepID=UPI0029528027|nr:glycyl peptide N-tetradecanoyl transferase [Ordospora pajunii]KAH9411748.1 glycyl peptide N-tetradecanoyl transferase [Ordospora pajunii]